jgi:hypothetical protein
VDGGAQMIAGHFGLAAAVKAGRPAITLAADLLGG